MYKILKTEFNYYGDIIDKPIVVKTVCSEMEAKRLLEQVFISDSFTKYSISYESRE